MKWLVHFVELVPYSGLDHVLKPKYAILQVHIIHAKFSGKLCGNLSKMESWTLYNLAIL